jgi:flagellar hook-basal body complex protein FliE
MSIDPVSPAGIAATDTFALAPARAATPPATAEGGDFGALLTGMLNAVGGALKTAEATAISGIKGEASVQQVVEAVMAAEQSLQSALAIRDKVVAAYLEVSRMSI